MTPLFFGTGTRRLFGTYLPARGRSRQRAVVLCHPFGPEYIRAHRAMRQWSRLLAEAGFDVLGFDYYGTGDSAGEMVDADVNGWLNDIDTAIEELMDTTGFPNVTLGGMRLGATLAATAGVRRRRGIDALLLWDPVVDGAAYVQQLHSDSGWVRPRPSQEGGGYEISGFPLTEAMAGQIAGLRLDLAAIPTLALQTQPDPVPLPAASAVHVVSEIVPDVPPWADEVVFGSRPLPVKAIQRLVEWLS